MRVLNSNSWMKSPITQPCATPPLHTSQSSGFLDHSSMSSPNQLACGHQGDMLFCLLLMCYNVTYNGLWMSCPNASCGLPIPCCLCPVCIFLLLPMQRSPTRPPRRSSITRLSQQEKVHSTREITAKVHLQTHQTSSHSWEIPECWETDFSPGNHQGGEGQHPGCVWKWPRVEYRYFWIRWVKFSPITRPVENNSIGIMKSLKSGLVSDLAKLCQS